MPRINIEESFWSDPRFTKLCCLMNDTEAAAGAVIWAWKMAQKFWIEGRCLIPEKHWKYIKSGPSLVDSGLAEKRVNGIYMVGSESNFEWIEKRKEAGRKGGLAKASKTYEGVAKLPSSSSSSSISKTTAAEDGVVEEKRANTDERTKHDKSDDSQLTDSEREFREDVGAAELVDPWRVANRDWADFQRSFPVAQDAQDYVHALADSSAKAGRAGDDLKNFMANCIRKRAREARDGQWNS